MRTIRQSILARAIFVALFGLVTLANAEDVIRVACVGDSVTWGSGVKDRKANVWPARLGSWLGTNYSVRNFGVSGATLLKFGDKPYPKQQAYVDALAFKPDILIIDLGTNDSKHPTDAERNVANNWQYSTNYIVDYEELIAAFRKANPAVKVYVCFPTPDFPGRWGINDRTIREEMIPMIRIVAKESNATIIDLYAPLSGKAELFPDTVHPNDEGTRLMAVEIYRALTGYEPPGVAVPAESLLMNRRVLWLGDSITQDGGYVSFAEYYLEKKFPGQTFDFISIGLASETLSGLSEKTHPFPRPCLFERLQRALDVVQPATVIACYGMNDGIYSPQNQERTKAFEDGVHRLRAEVEAVGAQLILLTPPPFDPLPVKSLLPETAPDFSFREPFTNYDSVLNAYSIWEKTLPSDKVSVVVDLHSALSQFLTAQREKNPQFSFTKDGIHPSPMGHLLMAQTILRAVGVGVNEGNLQTELRKIQADPLYQLVREQREKRSAGWLRYVGYTREKTVKAASVAETEKTVADLQARMVSLQSMKSE